MAERWPEDPTGRAFVDHDAAVQIATERRRVADELDRERQENVRLREIIRDARELEASPTIGWSAMRAILSRVDEQPGGAP